MNSPADYSVLYALNEAQTRQLHLLYQGEWWSAGRSLADVEAMLKHSDFVFAVTGESPDKLLAFARVLTDRVFKALVFDVIVHPDHRSQGIGSFLMDQIRSHPVLSRIRHIELYCLAERVKFYEGHGFSSDLGDLHFMRCENPPAVS